MLKNNFNIFKNKCDHFVLPLFLEKKKYIHKRGHILQNVVGVTFEGQIWPRRAGKCCNQYINKPFFRANYYLNYGTFCKSVRCL